MCLCKYLTLHILNAQHFTTPYLVSSCLHISAAEGKHLRPILNDRRPIGMLEMSQGEIILPLNMAISSSSSCTRKNYRLSVSGHGIHVLICHFKSVLHICWCRRMCWLHTWQTRSFPAYQMCFTFTWTHLFIYLSIQLDMRLWNTDAPGGNKVKLWQKSLSPTFWPRPTPRGMVCLWSVRNP